MPNSDLIAQAKRILLLLKKEGQIAHALQLAEELAVKHPGAAITCFTLGQINFVAAVAAREAAAGSEEDPADVASRSEVHLRRAFDAFSEAKVLAPDSVDVATALADILVESGRFPEAETEYRRALNMEMDRATSARPAVNSQFSSTPEESREACQRLANRLVSYEVDRIFDRALTTDGGEAKMKTDGDGGVALRMSKDARILAQRFPGSARAQLCDLVAQLQHMRSLPRELDMSKAVARLVRNAQVAAQTFPNSLVIALFHAKLLLVSRRLDAAEAECNRALDVEDASDPEEECVPLGSIGGDTYEARLSSVIGQFVELFNQIIGTAVSFWDNSLTAESKQRLLLVKSDMLQEEYMKVDQSAIFSMPKAFSFFKETTSWRFWMCPLCDSNKRHTMPGPLLKHMCKKHQRLVLPSLQLLVNSTFDLESDEQFDGVFFTEDEDKNDIIRFNERIATFRYLFYDTVHGDKAKPFGDIMRANSTEGKKVLQTLKKKMSNLPAGKSTDESPELCEIRELWFQFLQCSMFDCRKLVMTLAKTTIWRELKSHIEGVYKTASQKMTLDDIDAIFCPLSCKETSNETTKASVDQTGDIFCINSKHTELIDLVLKTLWSLRHFADEVMKTEALCSTHSHRGPCVGDMLHSIFCSWQKDEYHREELSLLAKVVHRILDDDECFEKVSDITFGILNGLHLPDTCLHLGFVGDVMGEVRRAFKCKYHDFLGIKFLMDMNCGCQTCSSEKHNADPNMAEQLCNQCTSAALKGPHSIIAVHWSDVREGQETLGEILDGWLQSVMTFEYKRGTAFYRLAAMICFLDGFPIGVAQKGNCWIMFNANGELSRCEDSWEYLLHMCMYCKPAVLLYEVIK